MTITFSDKLQSDAHLAFQAWRLKNPNGFFLAQKGRESYVLHHVGCHHPGSPFWDGVSLTASPKVCSPEPNELLIWLTTRDAVYHVCRHCVDTTDPTHLEPSPSARQRMADWIDLAAEEKGGSHDSWSFQEELSVDTPLFEGARLVVQVSAFERNPIARQKCISHYGASCCICDFNFGAVYGSSVEGYVHIHHLKPIASIGKEYVIDPINDLRPVCANCHAVIHSRQPPYSIEEVQRMLHVGSNI